MKIIDEIKTLIKNAEGLRLRAYLCPAGVWTIGYGHTKNVKKGDTITKQKAEELFEQDLLEFAEQVQKMVKVELNDNQFSALVSLAYNIGVGKKGLKTGLYASKVLRLVNESKFYEAAEQFMSHVRAYKHELKRFIVLPGLIERRKKEKEIFLRR